jgi:MOSC domain-containing protein YiiM
VSSSASRPKRLAGGCRSAQTLGGRVPSQLHPQPMIEHIFIRPSPGEPQVECQSVQVVSGAGINGDRYYAAQDEPGQNITFVEAEEIERFCAANCLSLVPSATGRNVVTRGVRLNDLVGSTFAVGGLLFRGVELCEPCLNFGESLATGVLTPAQIFKQWVGRAGLRADALSSGELSVGAGLRAAA